MAVGPALDRVTSVRLDDHVLRVEAASPQWGRELARSSPMILEGMQSFLGRELVDTIVVAGGERRPQSRME